jgi:hypothetical protein
MKLILFLSLRLRRKIDKLSKLWLLSIPQQSSYIFGIR